MRQDYKYDKVITCLIFVLFTNSFNTFYPENLLCQVPLYVLCIICEQTIYDVYFLTVFHLGLQLFVYKGLKFHSVFCVQSFLTKTCVVINIEFKNPPGKALNSRVLKKEKYLEGKLES